MPTFNFVLLKGVHVAQILASAASLYHSYSASTKLRKYEPYAESAAEKSDKAADQLKKTRTTQAAGTIAGLLSLLCALYLLFASEYLRIHNFYHILRSPQMIISAVNATVTTAARFYMYGFWHGSKKLPVAKDYSEALADTNATIWLLRRVSWAWIVSSVIFPH